MTEITDQDFDKEVLNCELPVFACFATRTCQSCYPACLIAEEIRSDYTGRVRFVKIDIQKSPDTAERYRITAVPTLIVFQGCRPVKRLIGFQRRGALRALLNKCTVEGT